MDKGLLQQKFNRIPLRKYQYRVFFPCESVPNLDNDTLTILNRQPNKTQSEHLIMIAKSRLTLFFADSLGRKKYSFLKKQNERMMPEPLQSHPNVCSFCTIYAAFPSP